ncbi:PD-(D/E)XK nuclease family protein [Candidatus Woesearchaeota archaeon]|nr:PD-(D/E)XK nuclease family protein [Candidatus Woesearchaeota archaeon]
MIISVTDLSAYFFCPRALYLQKVMGFRQPPTQSMVVGMFKHSVLEKANLAEKDAVLSIRKDMRREDYERVIFDSYMRVLEREIGVRECLFQEFGTSPGLVREQMAALLRLEAAARAGDVYDFALNTGLFGDSLWESLVPRILMEVRVKSDELMLRGRIDKAELFKDRCVVHEIKTGRVPAGSIWPSHRVQASAYCMLAEKHFNVKSDESVLNYSGIERIVRLNPFSVREVIETRDQVMGLFESDEAPECKRPNCSCRNHDL